MSSKYVTCFAGAVVLLAENVYSAEVVRLDGSSTVYPISEAVAEEFQTKQKEIHVTVGISGTGGGFKKFCRGELDVSDASRPILKKEMEECQKNGVQYYELPIAFDALTVVAHKRNPVKQITLAELKTFWEPDAQGKVTRWKQANPSFPDLPLKLFGPGSDSGTFDYFTEAVNGKAKSSRGDFTASEDDNVLVQGVQRDPGSLGYFGYAYYAENQGKLKALAIVDPKTGKAVLPSEKTVIDGTYQPLSRPIFIYVSEASYKKPEVKEFVRYYLENAAHLAKEVKYVPLPEKAYKISATHLQEGRVGTVFNGEAEVGVKIDDLLSRETKL
ncbi:Protein SphX [Gammaproteobacteria bacterium]